MKYQTVNENLVRRFDENGAVSFIPADPANVDYQAFLLWCEESNTPEPADEQGATA